MKRPFRKRDTARARALRNQASPAERALWVHLCNSQLVGHKFTRQYQIGPYFGDFVCRSHKLVVELDGFSHESAERYDADRTKFLADEGFQVIRFTNDDVKTNIDGVVTAIGKALADRPTPNPSRKREGDL